MENNTDITSANESVVDVSQTNEFGNNNQKENTMNICQAKKKDGAICGVSPKFTVKVKVSGFTAYREDKLPYNYSPADWDSIEILVCGTHQNMLANGKAINFTLLDTQEEITNTNQSKEDDMNTTPMLIQADIEPEEYDYDKEHSQQNQMKVFEGQPFDIHDLRFGGKVMIERCNHEDCQMDHHEAGAEMSREICCGEDNCNHYFVLTCLHHDETMKALSGPLGSLRGNRVQPAVYKVDGEWVNVPGRFKEWHRNNTYANNHINHLRELGVNMEFVTKKRAYNGNGFWVTWNADQTLADEFFANHKPKATVVEPKRVTFPEKENHGVLCGNCRKNGVENPYHPTIWDVKACYAGK